MSQDILNQESMKIISENDFRYEYLNEIFDTYNYENMLQYYPGEYPYITVPRLLVTNPIEKTEFNAAFTDRDGYVYSRSHAARQLYCFTELTMQELFDLTVLHINDTEDRPRCNECGCYLNWSGRFTAGYGSGGHTWDESEFHFCSRSCASSYQFNNLDSYPVTKQFIESGGTFGMMINNPDKYNWHETIAKSRKTALMQGGNEDDVMIFYVTWTNLGYLKFGVTYDINTRNSFSNFIDYYKSSHKVIIDTRSRLANIEEYIKIQLRLTNEYVTQDKVGEFWKCLRSAIDLF